MEAGQPGFLVLDQVTSPGSTIRPTAESCSVMNVGCGELRPKPAPMELELHGRSGKIPLLTIVAVKSRRATLPNASVSSEWPVLPRCTTGTAGSRQC